MPIQPGNKCCSSMASDNTVYGNTLLIRDYNSPTANNDSGLSGADSIISDYSDTCPDRPYLTPQNGPSDATRPTKLEGPGVKKSV